MHPATLKQLATAVTGTEANTFYIDGKKIHRVKVIAQIMGITKQTNAVTLELDDGTGRIETRYWLSPEAEEEEANAEMAEVEKWQEGVYIRVFGHLRQFKQSDKNSFIALSIKPITDFNEITFHLLESVFTHLKNLKDVKGDPMDIHSTSTVINNAVHPPQQGGVDLQPLYATVLEIIQTSSASSAEGASIQLICEQMSPYGLGDDQIKGAIQYLSSEGHIYPTFDEEHFKA